MPGNDFLAMLRMLDEHQVDFIVVGGVGAALQGAPVLTFDLDVVHSREPENVARLLGALEALGAYYLESTSHQLLMTRFGPLDLLGTVGRGRDYDDLLPHATEMDASGGVTVLVLDLETLIATKEEAGGEKDLATLPVLRQALWEKRRR